MIPTPIADFLDKYDALGAARFHMPGHKGAYRGDITEIDGAGDLFSDVGIVAESESAASGVFGSKTFYSIEGSSLAIRTMASLAVRGRGKRVIAARNAHVSFISAVIMLDLDVEWLTPADGGNRVFCGVTPDGVARAIDSSDEPPAFVYITSPDYLGNIADIAGIARVCHERGTLLLVDNAHGAYLKFLTPSLHPVDLGADMCADSAHKTLPVLTGGAYLHLSDDASKFAPFVKETMRHFATSSPSYPIMRSLDEANRILSELPGRLSTFAEKMGGVKKALSDAGWRLIGDEALKISLMTKPYGYTGDEVAEYLISRGIVAEFHDPDFISFMATPENTDEDLTALTSALTSLPRRAAIDTAPPAVTTPRAAMTPREAFFAEREALPPRECVGRIAASASVSCPPAIPIVMPGEVIDKDAADTLEYYGTKKVFVVK